MEYLLYLIVLSAIYGILAVSLNLVMGFTGLISLMHVTFFGIGAYAVAILSKSEGWNFFAATGVGMIISMIVGVAVSSLVRNLGGDYYVLGTLGINYLFHSILVNWQKLTQGPFGITAIPNPSLFGVQINTQLRYAVLAVVSLAVVYGITKYITHSSFGRILKTIREDEGAVRVFGYNTLHYKIAVFALAGGLAAIAGSLLASYITFIDPSTFVVMESAFVVAIVVLGGLASLKGSVLGAVVLVVIPEMLRFVGFSIEIAAQMRLMVYGVMLVVLMLYRPQGLLGEYKL